MAVVVGIPSGPQNGSDASVLAPDAAEVFAVAVELAKHLGDHELVAVHVLEEVHANPKTDAAARTALASLLAQAHAAGIKARTQIVVGPIVESLVALAETEAAKVLVVKARSTPGRAGLGTTAQQIVTQAALPVLLVRDAAALHHALASAAPLAPAQPPKRRVRIALGMDDSSVSDVARNWLRELTTSLPADVVLGTVYYADETSTHYGLPAGRPVDRHTELEALLARDMLRKYDVAAQDHVVARPKLGLGRIGDHLVELAAAESADLLVIGTAQKGALGRLGSVSSAVVATATQSVLCVPPTASVKLTLAPVPQTIVIATDLSAFANRAIPYGYALCARVAHATVHLVHVCVLAQTESTAAEVAQRLNMLIPTDADADTQCHVLDSDDAPVALATFANRVGADAICLASHGRTGLARALMGSVADQLLRITRKPVFVVRPQG